MYSKNRKNPRWSSTSFWITQQIMDYSWHQIMDYSWHWYTGWGRPQKAKTHTRHAEGEGWEVRCRGGAIGWTQGIPSIRLILPVTPLACWLNYGGLKASKTIRQYPTCLKKWSEFSFYSLVSMGVHLDPPIHATRWGSSLAAASAKKTSARSGSSPLHNLASHTSKRLDWRRHHRTKDKPPWPRALHFQASDAMAEPKRARKELTPQQQRACSWACARACALELVRARVLLSLCARVCTPSYACLLVLWCSVRRFGSSL